MSALILTQKTLIEERVKNALSKPVRIFAGTKEDNRDTAEAMFMDDGNYDVVQMASPTWVDSPKYHEVWNTIHNIQTKYRGIDITNTAQKPANADIAALIGAYFIDLTRRTMEQPDLTTKVASEETNFNFPATLTGREFYKFRGEFSVVSGSNDSVNLIEHATGTTDTLAMVMKALGDKTTIANILFNPIYSLQKVNQAIADAYVDARNAVSIGAIINATYAASQLQAADATSGASLDYKYYETVVKAIALIRSLKDITTGKPISTASGLKLIVNSAQADRAARVLFGQLQSNGTNGSISSVNVSGLPIDEIITYDSGINHGFDFKGKTMSYPGVVTGYAYLFVPYEFLKVFVKRPLTLETGRGSVLQLSQEERAWYYVQAEYTKSILGSSFTGTGLGAGYGACVKITWPT